MPPLVNQEEAALVDVQKGDADSNQSLQQLHHVVIGHQRAGQRDEALGEQRAPTVLPHAALVGSLGHCSSFANREDEQGDLFTRFFRTSTVEELDIQGTGLGLAIVKSIVESHGGTVSLSSELNAGTRVLVQIPLAAGRQAPPAGDRVSWPLPTG